MFLHVSVILSTGGSAPLHAGILPPPARQTLPPPLAGQTPPHAVHVGGYGQQEGGMHPTGMQSC